MQRLSTAGGVEMPPMDLSKPLNEAEKQLVRDAFLEHHILVFREQTLSKEEQAAFTQQFGELESHVARRHDGTETPIVHTVSMPTVTRPTNWSPTAITSGTPTNPTTRYRHSRPCCMPSSCRRRWSHAVRQYIQGPQALPDNKKHEYADLKAFTVGRTAATPETVRPRMRKTRPAPSDPSFNPDLSRDRPQSSMSAYTRPTLSTGRKRKAVNCSTN